MSLTAPRFSMTKQKGSKLFCNIVLISKCWFWVLTSYHIHFGCIGCLCPCFLFGKNAEFLGSGTFLGSCVTHFILWSVVNTACCLLTDGLFLGLPGCLVSCYACGYRKALRSKYNLPEAPCGDFVTHFCCHPCAICQEYREICERSGDSEPTGLKLAVVTAPTIQTMEPDSKK
ncbi:protein PLANT CADMIUM RESISTANCE 10 isoform X2 [Phaseolus vulgaris]|uniref:protein PLANT CADMIUM RESISTANCE 10 isoform X2 n=1 Tax=Phaseolus vulgaris TaxID=3885 RepID=UPI0035CB9CBB